ncbi:penicillin-binding protein activator [Minwuia sp.]|uniref:penicillin-binding protein activator n=1 Tax=Minwuia sp. TaxID=2493630 RepID=UPI003A8DE208
MNRFAFGLSRFLLLPLLVAPLLIAGCENTAGNKPTTDTAAAAKPTPRQQQPKPEPLPPGLQTGGLDDIETNRAKDSLDSLYALNRPEGEQAPLRVAVLLPLSGIAAGAGDIMLKAAQLAVFDSGEKRLMLMPHDTKSTPEGAIAAAEAADADGAQLVLGPLFGDHVQPVAQVMAPKNIPVLAFSNDQSAAGNGAAILGLTPESELRRMLSYAGQRGLRRIAAFLPDSDYGYLVAEKIRSLAPQLGLEAARINHYPAGAQASDDALLQAARSFASYDARRSALARERSKLQSRGDSISRRALARLSGSDTFGAPPYDAVLLAEPRNRLPTIAPLLAFYDVDPKRVQFLGMSSWYGDGLGREPSLVGSWFTGPDPEQYEALMKRYSEKYNMYPGRLAALAYDAVAVAADLVGSVGPEGRITSDQILLSSGYAAYYGPFRVNREGTTDRLLSIIQIDPDGLTVIDRAPATFDTLTN